MTSKVLKYATRSLLLGVGIGAGLYAYDPLLPSSSLRVSRALLSMAGVALDYKYTWWKTKDLETTDPVAYEKTSSDLHQRSAERVLKLCETNKGLYIKVGQYLSTLTYVLPKEYTRTLQKLQDQAPTVDFATVKAVIKEDLGKEIDEVFSHFDPNPLAAASLAQVHHAVTKDGQEVAVKIQYPELRKNFSADMLVHYLILKSARFLFKGFRLEWMHPEIEENLSKELDFENEGRNAERTAENFRKQPEVYVPKIFWNATSKRILTMEFIHGFKITNRKALEQEGFDLVDVCSTAVQAMSDMIFVHGFVHCDPHPGNLFVRRKPATGLLSRFRRTPHQVVILDHGLYREMSSHTRKSYCDLWHALILRDDARVKAASEALGVKNWHFLAVAVLMRPYKSSIVGFANPVRKSDVEEMVKEFEGDRFGFFGVMEQMPRELLLVFRNQNYIRALGHELGYPVNRFRIMARSALRGKYGQGGWVESRSVIGRMVDRVGYRWEKFRFEWNLWSSDAIMWLMFTYLKWFRPDTIQQLESNRFMAP
eukprot:TRINITY_DN2030_c0_g3_i1.p1 TRINITY_DN2030_c0_g3~~TRINITY_DN2030_c0_g3_i1.p1  ORF type:complete len:560 (-),score=59.09 TRINITY_DN2030_c0_g3_i1:65-1678(-)